MSELPETPRRTHVGLNRLFGKHLNRRFLTKSNCGLSPNECGLVGVSGVKGARVASDHLEVVPAAEHAVHNGTACALWTLAEGLGPFSTNRVEERAVTG
jgi:hypothetical protein